MTASLILEHIHIWNDESDGANFDAIQILQAFWLRTWNHLEARMVGRLRQKEAPGNTEVDEEEGGSWVPRLIRSPPKAEHIPLNALIFGGNTNTHTRW